MATKVRKSVLENGMNDINADLKELSKLTKSMSAMLKKLKDSDNIPIDFIREFQKLQDDYHSLREKIYTLNAYIES